MSGPNRVWKLLEAEREHNTITLELQDENGETERLTLGVAGDSNSPHPYTIKQIGRGVSGVEFSDELTFYVTGPEQATYAIRVLPDDADEVWERFASNPKHPPKISSITYGDDYLTISYDGGCSTLKLGLDPERHRLTLTGHGGTYRESEPGYRVLGVSFRDENSEQHYAAFSVPSSEANRIDAEVHAFLKVAEPDSPKFEAVPSVQGLRRAA